MRDLFKHQLNPGFTDNVSLIYEGGTAPCGLDQLRKKYNKLFSELIKETIWMKRSGISYSLLSALSAGVQPDSETWMLSGYS